MDELQIKVAQAVHILNYDSIVQPRLRQLVVGSVSADVFGLGNRHLYGSIFTSEAPIIIVIIALSLMIFEVEFFAAQILKWKVHSSYH
ncbi:hypothetical protein Vadar_030085 [Vaccinium darrowii]|uniref:Uncharacterized protein n=1 Tax=Vaccinium darrowii TaxID=229202 RepID=A0ACB7ZG14_9ERIC|nr:hypothetical protein Vadar_030085 [Vaccinium darrowii]